MISTAYDNIAQQWCSARTTLLPKESEYLALLLENLRPESTVLDLGCGTGHPIANYVASYGHHVVGVDGSKPMLELACSRLPEQRWIHDLMERVNFTETFDAVICWDSLFHLPRQHFGPIISNIHRWLRDGGRLMVSSGGQAGDDGKGFTDTMFGHEFYYDSPSPDDMVMMIERTGFDIVLAEVCDKPDGARNKGKWATIASRRAQIA